MIVNNPYSFENIQNQINQLNQPKLSNYLGLPLISILQGRDYVPGNNNNNGGGNNGGGNNGGNNNNAPVIPFNQPEAYKGQDKVTSAITTGNNPKQDYIASHNPNSNTTSDASTDWTSLETLLTLGGGLAGGLLPAIAGMKSDMQRIREVEVDQALQQNLANRDQLLNQSPEANRLAKANALQMGRANAVNAAATAGASNMANAGMNGDISSALVAGVQAAAPIAQATQSYDQALANTFTERAQEQATLNQQIGQNTMDRGVLADMTAYYDKNKMKGFVNIMNNMLGGVKTGSNIYDILTQRQQGSTENKD